MLQLQAHNQSGTITLCHTSCVSPARHHTCNSGSDCGRVSPSSTEEHYRVTSNQVRGVHRNPQLAPNACPTLTVKFWMDSNTNEGATQYSLHSRTCSSYCGRAVVTLLIVNSDGVSPSLYDTVYKAVGLDALSYAPPSAVTVDTAWPSLGSMIDSGKRLVTFLDSGADFTTVPYIIDGRVLQLASMLSVSSLTIER